MTTQPPKLVFLFDSTRHRSHLFFRYLSTHEKVLPLWHVFLTPFLFGPERIVQFTTPTTRGVGLESSPILPTNTYKNAEETLQKYLDEAAKTNKILVANEHCQMVTKQSISLSIIRHQEPPHEANPTVIPDHLFNTLTPIFIIRHPIFAVPSNYKILIRTTNIRPGDEDWDLITLSLLQRRLFDFFLERDGKPPIVVDGDDVLWRTEEIGKKLCEVLALEGALSENWEPVPEDERSKDPMIRHFLKTIDESKGIERPEGERPEVDIERVRMELVEEYGEEVGYLLMERVRENMPHYEYMQQFKI